MGACSALDEELRDVLPSSQEADLEGSESILILGFYVCTSLKECRRNLCREVFVMPCPGDVEEGCVAIIVPLVQISTSTHGRLDSLEVDPLDGLP